MKKMKQKMKKKRVKMKKKIKKKSKNSSYFIINVFDPKVKKIIILGWHTLLIGCLLLRKRYETQ